MIWRCLTACAVVSSTIVPWTSTDPAEAASPDRSDAVFAESVAPLGGTGYVALASARLLDTRTGAATIDGIGSGSGAVAAGGEVTVQVLGRGGVPSSDVGAVNLRLTVVAPSGGGYAVVSPTGSPRPTTTSVTFNAGLSATNLSTVAPGDGGAVTVAVVGARAHVIVEVVGWYPSASALRLVEPQRVLDMRARSTSIGGGATAGVVVGGVGDVPSVGVEAVVVNVTVIGSTRSTFITAHAFGASRPNVAHMVVAPGRTTTTQMTVPIGANGRMLLYNGVGRVQLVVDVVAWIAVGPGYRAVAGTRVVDTRASLPIGPGAVLTVPLVGVAGVPSTGVGSVLLTLTGVGASSRSFLTVWPAGTPPPVAADLLVAPGPATSTVIVARLGAGGAVSIRNDSGAVGVIVDVLGWAPSHVVTTDDTYTLEEDAGDTTLDVLANDVDLDGHPLRIASVTSTGTAAVSVSADGTSLVHRSAPGACGGAADVVTYTLLGGATGTATVTVECVDDAPVAVDDETTVTEDASQTDIDVLANDTDADGGTLEVDSVTQPANGTVVVDADGSGLSYEPDAEYCNDGVGGVSDDFSYTLNGGDVGTVSVTVECVDDAATAVDDEVTVTEDDTATVVTVLANDDDPDGGPTATVASVTQPVNGSSAVSADSESVTYTPDADYCNEETTTDWFTYTLDTGDVGTVYVTVLCVDDAPVAVDDTQTVAEDDAATAIDVLANDTDLDDGTMEIDSVTQPANGTVVVDADGSGLSYEPDADYCNDGAGGVADEFSYTLNGGASASVDVTVECVDDATVAVDDELSVTEDDAAMSLAVTSNDTDVDGEVETVASVTQPANGTVVVGSDSTSIEYTPDADYCNDAAETDDFTYTLDGGDVGTVSVSVTCVDDAPVAVDDEATVTEDASATAIDVLANETDIDGGASPVVASVTQPDHGTVVVDADGGGLTYAPDANSCNDGSPTDWFTYTLETGDVATVDVTVTCVDDPTLAVDDDVTVAEDAAATDLGVVANDTDVEGDDETVTSATQPAHGTVVVAADGSDVSYEPDPNYCNDGVTTDDFTYTLAGGGTGTVAVTVTCVDDGAVAVDDSSSMTEDDSATAIDVLANDTDIDAGSIAVDSVTQPSNGTVVVDADGSGLSYEPDADYCNDGVTTDDFTYTLDSGSVADVSVSVACVDDPTVAVDDAATITEDDSATAIDVVANDSDPDGGSATSVVSVTQPSNGTVVVDADGSGLSYEPDADYCNDGVTTDDFTYTLGGGATASVTVTVTCVDDAPVAVDDEATVTEDASATAIDVLANDTDIDAGPIAVDSVTQPSNGTVVVDADGSGLSYEPDADYCNDGVTTDDFTYTLDGGASATVSVSVTCVNDAPSVSSAPTYTVVPNMSRFIGATDGLLVGASDPDGATTLSVADVSATTPSGGIVAVTASSGAFDITPPAGHTGALSFTYKVCDDGDPAPAACSDPITVNVTVSGQVVWFVDDSAALGGDGTLSKPFRTLAAAETAIGTDTGESVFLFSGSYSTGITLRSSGRLVGQQTSGSSFDALVGLGSVPTGTQARPSTGLGSVSLGGGVTLGTSAFVRGVSITTTSGTALSGAAAATVDVAQVSISASGSSGRAVYLSGGSGTVQLATVDVTDNLTTGLELAGTDTSVTVSGGDIDSGKAVWIDGGSGAVAISATITPITASTQTVKVVNRPSGAGAVQFLGAVAFGSASTSAPAIQLSTNHSSTSVTFGGVVVVTTTGEGLIATNAGSVTATAAGNSIVSASCRVLGVTGGSGQLAFNLTGANVSVTNSTAAVTVRGGTLQDPVVPCTALTAPYAVVSIAGATGNVDVAATVSGSSNSNVTAVSMVAGTAPTTSSTVNFTGSITSMVNSKGVSISGLTDKTTVNFSGGLTLASGTNDAFVATSGKLSVSGLTNTITSGTGRALVIDGATITNTGVTLRSVSAGTAATGPVNGIVLRNTGSNGGVTVTGTGSDHSGGLIQKTSGAAIVLSNTKSPSFDELRILDPVGSGIEGTGVNGFTLTDSTIEDAGDLTDVDSSALSFATVNAKNLEGAVSISRNTVLRPVWHGIDIVNASGVISSLEVSGNSITSATDTAASLGSAVRVQMLGSTSVTEGSITSNTIRYFPNGGGVLVQTAGDNLGNASIGTSTAPFAITLNLINGESTTNRMGTSAIAVSIGDRSTGHVTVSTNGTVVNPMSNTSGSTIALGANGEATASFTVDSNRIAAANDLNSSGISIGTGRVFASSETPSLAAAVTNNAITGTAGSGILAVARGATGSLVLRIVGNSVGAPSVSGMPGIRVDAGNLTSADDAVCLEISGNTSAGNGVEGIALRRQSSPTAAFGIEGLEAIASPGVETYVAGNNTAGGGTVLLAATDGFTNCTVP